VCTSLCVLVLVVFLLIVAASYVILDLLCVTHGVCGPLFPRDFSAQSIFNGVLGRSNKGGYLFCFFPRLITPPVVLSAQTWYPNVVPLKD